MRRLAAALLATTLLLAGCSGSDEEPTPEESAAAGDPAATGEATADDIAALEAVTLEGEVGAAPTLTFEQPFSVANPVARVETEGDGAPIEDGQSLSVNYVAVSGDDGSELGSTWEQGAPETLILGDGQIIPALNDALTGQNIGVRVLFAAPGGEATEETETSPASPAYPATLMAIEVVDARSVPTRAEGEAVAPAPGLPVVTLAEDGQPSIEVPADAVAPTELVTQPLITGSGPVVVSGQTVTFQYSGWLFDGTPFDSSWENGAPFTTNIGTGSVIPGWDQAIVGQTVGTQLLLVIPPDLAYGEAGSPPAIPAGATLIFVVDILDAA